MLFSKKTYLLSLILTILVVIVSGCTVTTVKRENSFKNAGIGAGIGAGAGAIIGAFFGEPAVGAGVGAVVGAGAGRSVGEAKAGDVVKIHDKKTGIIGKKMFAKGMKREFKRLDISNGYTKTIMRKIAETESSFPGSLYWLDEKYMLLKHDLKVKVATKERGN